MINKYRILSEEERLGEIYKRLSTSKDHIKFDLLNENQRAFFLNSLGKDYFQSGLDILNNKTRSFHFDTLIKDCEKCIEQKINPLEWPTCHIGDADSNFNYSLRSFEKLDPKLRTNDLKLKIIPYLLDFERMYLSKIRGGKLKELSDLYSETPDNTSDYILRSSEYFQGLSKTKKNVLMKADNELTSRFGRLETETCNELSNLYEIAEEPELALFFSASPLGDKIGPLELYDLMKKREK